MEPPVGCTGLRRHRRRFPPVPAGLDWLSISFHGEILKGDACLLGLVF
jgi:hypothetical protein